VASGLARAQDCAYSTGARSSTASARLGRVPTGFTFGSDNVGPKAISPCPDEDQGGRLFWLSQKRANSSNHRVVRVLKNSDPPPCISGSPTRHASARIKVPGIRCSRMIVLSVANPASSVCDRYRMSTGGLHSLITYRPETTIG
jgi:hypothetical protein